MLDDIKVFIFGWLARWMMVNRNDKNMYLQQLSPIRATMVKPAFKIEKLQKIKNKNSKFKFKCDVHFYYDDFYPIGFEQKNRISKECFDDFYNYFRNFIIERNLEDEIDISGKWYYNKMKLKFKKESTAVFFKLLV